MTHIWSPVVLGVDDGYKGDSRAQVPPQFPPGKVSISELPTGDWSAGLSVN